MPFIALPVELQTLILEIASDDGQDHEHKPLRHTVHALCLVSRYFYRIAMPILYRDPCLTGHIQTTLFARTILTNAAFPYFSCVQHLLISDRYPGHISEGDIEIMPDFAFEHPIAQEERMERFRLMAAWQAERSRLLHDTWRAMQAVLYFVAPTLRTLTFLHYTDVHPASLGTTRLACGETLLQKILELPYPQLREFTVRGPFWTAGVGMSISMPKLERLHITGTDRSDNPILSAVQNRCLDFLHQLFPRLTHLRIARLHASANAVAHIVSAITPRVNTSLLSNILDPSRPGQSSSSLLFLPDLEVFILQPIVDFDPPPSDDMDVDGSVPDADSDTESEEMELSEAHYVLLEPLIRMQDLEGFYFEFLHPPASRWTELYDISIAMRDWTERVRGQGGCWGA